MTTRTIIIIPHLYSTLFISYISFKSALHIENSLKFMYKTHILKRYIWFNNSVKWVNIPGKITVFEAVSESLGKSQYNYYVLDLTFAILNLGGVLGMSELCDKSVKYLPKALENRTLYGLLYSDKM